MKETDQITITLNGDRHQTAVDSKVTDLIEALKLAPERVAVEFNLSILPRSQWAETTLKEGDRVEIVHFVGGGG